MRIIFLLTATLLFISCTDVERDNPDDMRSIYGAGGSTESESKIVYGPSVSHGGETYETVVIGTQIWFKRNLNLDVEGSVCGDCYKYGRLYNWATAMALDTSCNHSSCSSQINTPHQGICPSGWHIHSNADWDKLVRYVDGTSGTSSPYYSPTAGRYLKATSGWNSNGNGQDTYGFSALPGGYGLSDGSFYDVGNYGTWWSASEYDSFSAYRRLMTYNYENVNYSSYDKSNLYSVRCVQD